MKYLFLHGLIAFPSDWDSVIATMTSSGIDELEAPDLKFLTGDVVEPEDYANALAAELPEGYPDDCIVVGHSIGCTVALCLLDRARHAFLLAPHTRFRTEALPRRDENMLNEINGLVYDPARFSDEQRYSHVNLWKGVLRSRKQIRQVKRLKDAMLRFDHNAHYARYADKITFVLGKQDAISPLEDFGRLRKLLRTTVFHEIDRCCHAIPLEHPSVVANLLLGEPAPA